MDLYLGRFGGFASLPARNHAGRGLFHTRQEDRVMAQQPDISHDLGEPEEAHLVEDACQGVRVVHERPLDPASPIQAALLPDRPSVWEASPRDE
jgi:hypothetical protein